MFKKVGLAAAVALMMSSLAGCGLGANVAAPSQTPGTVVKDAGLGGTGTATFDISVFEGRMIQSTVHRYEAADITKYVVTLFELANGDDETTGGTQVAEVTVNSTTPKAVFTHLKKSVLYRANIAAYSTKDKTGATVAEHIINSNQTDAFMKFQFDKAQDQDNAAPTVYYNGKFIVRLDNSDFDGSSTADSGDFTVEPGQYVNPTTNVDASAQ